MICCNVYLITKYPYVYYQWQSVRGTPNILIFGIFIDNLSTSEQIIDRALTIHTELYNYDSMKKNNFIWFSPHIPKLSIGFKFNLIVLDLCMCVRVCGYGRGIIIVIVNNRNIRTVWDPHVALWSKLCYYDWYDFCINVHSLICQAPDMFLFTLPRLWEG